MFKNLLFHSLLVFGFSLSLVTMYGQAGPSCRYDFDNMDLTESTGNYSAGIAKSIAKYECGAGLNSTALFFDGSADTILLDPQIKEIFNNANRNNSGFTFTFDFWIEEGSSSYSLFAIDNNCFQDSSLIIRYIESINEIQIKYARDASETVLFTEKLDVFSCWHNFMLIKDGDDYTFYLDGKFIETQRFIKEIIFGQDFEVYVGFSDCVPLRDGPFVGKIDDIQVYNYALDDLGILSLNKFTDQIISVDTTIFEGDSYQIVSGPSCTSNIKWTPTFGLSDPSISNPIATPTETNIYMIEYNHGNCITTDSVRISVIKEDNINCENVLLPKAFTPNGDRLNDVFSISNNFILSDISRFEIFDRWGLKIFETLDKRAGWDGTYKGQKLGPGTYVFKIEYECKDENYQKTGSFSLLK